MSAPAADHNAAKPIPHVPQASRRYKNSYNGFVYNIHTWLYDVSVFLFNILFTIFFREIKVRGAYNVPEVGVPTILVCAPHANQFIDPALVMSQTRLLKTSAGKSRSRMPCFVTAESSFKKRFISFFGHAMGGIPVPRIQDNLKPVDENLEIYAPDLKNHPEIIKGRSKNPQTTPVNFTKRFSAKSLLGLPDYLSNAQIKEIPDDETIILSSPFRTSKSKVVEILTNGTNFKYAEKIDNTETFQSVFDHLHTKGCVGIFPEGGSHDRPSLLPIKAGVAIMALGAVAADPTMKVAVVPCGLHYFHRNKFRSRAVLEYGEPIVVDGKYGEMYKNSPRETVSKLLKKITNSLFSVTENAPDYDTLMVIQAARRLYQPVKVRLPLPAIVEINRRLLFGYSKFKDDPRIIHLKKLVYDYNRKLDSVGLKDHQVMQLKTTKLEALRCFVILIVRLIKFSVFAILSLPGSILFTPIFIICRVYSEKKAKEGLKKSLVKIKGTDLLATWKLIVALILAPILYVTYSILLIILARKQHYCRIWVPSNNAFIQFVYFYALLVFTTYSSLKTGEIGVDLFKSLRPLFVSIVYPGKKIEEIQTTRKNLSLELTAVCNDLGPLVFPDYDKLATEIFSKRDGYDVSSDAESSISRMSVQSRSRSSSIHSIGSLASNALSRVNSRGSLTDIPIFSDAKQGQWKSEGETSEDEDEFDEKNPAIVQTAQSSDLNKENSRNTNISSKIASLVRQKREHEKKE
ncbi:BAH_G0033400.mRNA.1.CDS.1 [Saccharomyces cerevisiae]|nr:SX2_G0005480.mRNA.1.CDS.1 [Saccharomyces cerevisiae]CAI4576497.1 BAH_G0033400.mRNA.1.CDS.1 [Saccharomyces cerevisiae]CAI4582177.1 BAG_1a_G0033480.mRNA.1.CDS.1 [Saccharomyces cerevisiae]CAI7191446.1 BAG_1a_G0033480.mRNA.1.CDS.1 [Saccharomyces cerevisiae]CAI7192912.1 BAH_G0033400.mRNA.1.CDS.1 [Saccharomyces cerevisiae]